MKIVVDSNIVFSALLSHNNICRFVLTSPKMEIYSCNFLFVEIFKHKKKIQSLSCLEEDLLLTQLEILMNCINFIREEIFPSQIYRDAFYLCKKIDEKDTPFVALSIFLDAFLLTGDKKLYNHLNDKKFKVIGIDEIKDYYLSFFFFKKI